MKKNNSFCQMNLNRYTQPHQFSRLQAEKSLNLFTNIMLYFNQLKIKQNLKK